MDRGGAGAPSKGVGWVAIVGWALLVLTVRPVGVAAQGSDPDTAPWAQIAQQARAIVAHETPPGVWPFTRNSPEELRSSRKKVFAHYMPFFVLSYENGPLDRDHWAQFLSAGGENGKWARQGGFTRERPLTPGPWDSANWQEIDAAVDVLRGQAIGLDAFGVDLTGLEPGDRPSQVRILCRAAAAVAPGFGIVLEPDADILQHATPQQMADTIQRLAACPAVYRLPDRRILVAPFFTNKLSVDYWRDVLARLSQMGQSAALLSDLLGLGPVAAEYAPISYGLSFWGPRDPASATSPALLDQEAAARAEVQAWMLPVAPQDVRPKNMIFWESANTETFRTLWMQAIRQNLDYVHVVTWNAYAEATEIAPSSGTQFLFYDLTAYYLEWFKTGQPPRIERDAIYYSHRTALIPADGGGFKVMGKTPVRNNVEMVALLTAPGVLVIDMGGRRYSRDVGAGLQVMQAPAAPGRPAFSIERNGRTVAQVASAWSITETETPENPMYFGGSSTRAFVAMPAAR
jgi:hypothetical protein